MVKQMETQATNLYIKFLIRLAKKTAREEKAKIWEDVAELLAKPNRKRAEMNVAKLNKLLENGETVIVPGKVLGGGDLKREVEIAALNFSNKAKKKIKDAGGTTLKIEELIEKNPTGSGVRIII